MPSALNQFVAVETPGAGALNLRYDDLGGQALRVQADVTPELCMEMTQNRVLSNHLID